LQKVSEENKDYHMKSNKNALSWQKVMNSR